PISIEDSEDITRTRILLETQALRQSIAVGGEDWEAGVVAAFHRLSRAEQKLGDDEDYVQAAAEDWEKCNRGFHDALIAASPSRWMRHFQNILYQQSERYRRISLFRKPVPRDVHAEHQALFDATLARDTDRATAILTEHILRTLESVRHMPTEFFAAHTKR